MAGLRLDPENAARSIQVRLNLIRQCMDYIDATVARYDGLKSFETELEKLGIANTVAEMVKSREAGQ